MNTTQANREGNTMSDATDTIAETGIQLRESIIDMGVEVDNTEVSAYAAEDGTFWTRWLDNNVDEWEQHASEAAAVAHYEAMVRDTYPLTDPDTDEPTWTTSDVDGVPTHD